MRESNKKERRSGKEMRRDERNRSNGGGEIERNMHNQIRKFVTDQEICQILGFYIHQGSP